MTLQKGIGKKMAETSAQNWLPTISFSPDSKLLASYRANEQVRVWDVQSGKQVATLQYHGALLSFSNDGKMLAVFRRHAGARPGGTVRVWDVATKKELAAVESKEAVKTMNFSTNGKMLVATSEPVEGKLDVTVWEIETSKVHLTTIAIDAQVVARGGTLVVQTNDGLATFWDLNTGRMRAKVELHSPDK